MKRALLLIAALGWVVVCSAQTYTYKTVSELAFPLLLKEVKRISDNKE